MDAPVLSQHAPAVTLDEVTRRLDAQRDRLQRLLGDSQERVGAIEERIARQISAVIEEFERREVELAGQAEDLAARAESLDQREVQLATRAAELEAGQLALARADEEAAAERERLKEQLALEAAARMELLASERDSLRAERDQLSQRACELGVQLAEALDQVRAAQRDLATAQEQLRSLQAERALLLGRIAEFEMESEDRKPEELDDLRRRLEMAMDDIRRLRSENQRLTSLAPSHVDSDGSARHLDWEERKRRLLQQLNDEDVAPDDEERAEQRLCIETAVKQMDAVLKDREREIEELKQLLEQQCAQAGEMALGAQAIGAVLNQDELIQHERRRVEELRKEWEEKLRSAEVELSLERAKLARRQAELEERARVLDEQSKRDTKSAGGAAGGSAHDRPPEKRRWLSRLGLREE